MIDDVLVWIVALALLGAIMFLASVAWRAGESAGHPSFEGAARGSAPRAANAIRRMWALLRLPRRR